MPADDNPHGSIQAGPCHRINPQPWRQTGRSGHIIQPAKTVLEMAKPVKIPPDGPIVIQGSEEIDSVTQFFKGNAQNMAAGVGEFGKMGTNPACFAMAAIQKNGGGFV